jgi:integrase
MKGGIYTEEDCPICGQRLKDNGRAVTCPSHPKQRAYDIFVKFGRDIKKRLPGGNYEAASQFLNGLRFETGKGTFDKRDYMSSNPLGFKNLAEKWMERKQDEVKYGSFQSLRPLMQRAIFYFGDRNVKDIRYADLDDYLRELKKTSGLSSKTIHNLFSHLHGFWQWLIDREEIRADQVPRFPRVAFELGWRKTTDKATQQAILDKVWDICHEKTPRAWFAIFLCSSNVNIRPGELAFVLEEDVDLEGNCIWIRNHKTKRHTQAPKAIPLLEEDIQFIRSVPKGFPKMPFFRRDKGGGGRFPNAPFGQHFLIDVWNRACKSLGVEGVGLYGGTRHTTCQYLRRQGQTPEQVKRYTDHSTNKAFDRYLLIEIEEKIEGVRLARGLRSPLTKCGPEVVHGPNGA